MNFRFLLVDENDLTLYDLKKIPNETIDSSKHYLMESLIDYKDKPLTSGYKKTKLKNIVVLTCESPSESNKIYSSLVGGDEIYSKFIIYRKEDFKSKTPNNNNDLSLTEEDIKNIFELIKSNNFNWKFKNEI